MHDFSAEDASREFANLGVSAHEAADNLSALGRSLAEIDYARLEERVAAWSSRFGKKTLFGTLVPEWRKVGRQRARTLRRRGEHVEWRMEAGGYVWLRHLDPVKLVASEIYGVPYAEVHPHLRRAAKGLAMMRAYGETDRARQAES